MLLFKSNENPSTTSNGSLTYIHVDGLAVVGSVVVAVRIETAIKGVDIRWMVVCVDIIMIRTLDPARIESYTLILSCSVLKLEFS